MATQTVGAIEVAFEPFYAWENLEANSSTFKIGALLTRNANGLMAEGGADVNMIYGVATRAGQNNTPSGGSYKTVSFTPVLPGTILEGNLVLAADGNLTLVGASHVGLRCGVIKRTTESDTPWAFDAGDTTDVRVKVIGLKDASGDVNGRVYAVVLASYIGWAA